ncbi:MAG: TIM44-like domain-containing protein [Thermoleophilia bacterium]
MSRARRTLLAVAAAAIAAAALPATGLALAGGATGGGGGGGGGYSGGGGGYSGGGGDGASFSGPWWVLLLVILSPWLLLLFISAVGKQTGRGLVISVSRARRAEVQKALAAADLGDGYWHPHALVERVRECFFPVQRSWAARDVESSRPYVSDALYERHRLQLEGLAAQNRVNRIEDLSLGDIEIVRVHNVTDDGEDRFVALLHCAARDWMEDAATGAFVNGNKETVTRFTQFWSFARDPERGWVLDEIQQGTEGGYHLTAKLVNQDEGPVQPSEPAGSPTAPG